MITKPIQFARSLEGSGSRNQATSQNLLTADEVAALTGLSVETLAQWRSQRRGIPYVKISRNCVRYRQSDLDDWLAERIVRTDQDVPNTGGEPKWPSFDEAKSIGIISNFKVEGFRSLPDSRTRRELSEPRRNGRLTCSTDERDSQSRSRLPSLKNILSNSSSGRSSNTDRKHTSSMS